MTIDPSAKHTDYVAFEDVWQRCRDAAGGQRKIKAGGNKYLPDLAGHDTASYKQYLERANYFNATGRTVDGMVGMVFRKPVKVTVPDAVEPWLDDITLADESLDDFATECLQDTLIVGRGGILVDMERSNGTLTQAQADAIQLRPYLNFYPTESIVNWERDRTNGAYRLKNVFLGEGYKNEQGDTKMQYRQLTIQQGFYEQIIWQNDGSGWKEISRVVPLKNGAAILEIPFFPLSPEKPSIEVTDPPIEDLADVNIAHYRNSADLENGVHLSGMPTLFIIGHDGTDETGAKVSVPLGGTVANFIPNSEADAKFVQVGAEGFAAIEKAMDRKEQHMAALGARMIAPEKKQAETAEAAGIRRGGENSVLAKLAAVVDRQIEKALAFAVDWQGLDGSKVEVELNKDLVPPNVTSADLLAWLTLVQSGKISNQTFYDFLGYSEWVRDDFTQEDEEALIQEDGPSLSKVQDRSIT